MPQTVIILKKAKAMRLTTTMSSPRKRLIGARKLVKEIEVFEYIRSD
jgi:hypothetical protein